MFHRMGSADLVGRKLSGDGGAELARLIAEIRAEAGDGGLLALAAQVEECARHLLEAEVDDRLAASVPFLQMVAVMTSGWLMERQARIAASARGDAAFLKSKQATASFFLRHIVAEALGLAASVKAGAAGFYELSAEELAA
jgi:3-(methylthio)propanoyl-CoA dehydrogenase